VTDFLAGITDSRLSNAKDLFLGDPDRLQNFEACQQYLKTLVYNKTTQEKHERQISAAQQGSGKGKGEDGKSKNSNGKRLAHLQHRGMAVPHLQLHHVQSSSPREVDYHGLWTFCRSITLNLMQKINVIG